MKEGYVPVVAETVCSLAGVHARLRDAFYLQKTQRYLESFMIASLDLPSASPTDVAQYTTALQVIQHSVDRLLDLVTDLMYLQMAPLPLLLTARKNLLKVKIVLRRYPPIRSSSVLKETRNSQEQEPKKANAAVSISLSLNQQKIFDFIKRSPSVRPKDIMQALPHLSERTVKRNLKELIREGLLKKRSLDNGVYYSPVHVS